MKDTKAKNSVSIRSIIIITFILSVLISVAGIGCMVFSNWASSAKQTTERLAEDMNQEISNQINSFIHVPEHINEINRKLIENSILDLSNIELREKFFVGVLASHDKEIYSFSYGTAGGEYFGARRNENGVIEIMRNNTDTGGNSWYYSVNEDLTAGELVVQAGKFDPRTRAWYIAAEQSGELVFSPVYKHFVMDDLTISAAWPDYNEEGELQGVLGTHMLLTGVGDHLEDIVRDNSGYAFIIEKGTGALIANSLGEENFTVLEDGTIKRHTLGEVDNSTFRRAYEQYSAGQTTHFLYEDDNESLYVNVQTYDKNGLDWVILSAIPESLLTAEISRNIRATIFIVILAVFLSAGIYYAVTTKLLLPMEKLITVTKNLASGDLAQRAIIARNDEIGRISEAFNKMADNMSFLINNLEGTVKARTEDLAKTNGALEESKNHLRLILDSAAEAIYGIDMEGDCTFCNASCIKLLGYSSQDDLLGKNMHRQIHHSHKGGAPFPVEACRILQAIRQGKGTHADDEVFWKADGTSFDAEYHSHPQFKNGHVVGAVVTFMDITERKIDEAQIKYLGCHDSMTGLMNRRCFENELKKLDTKENLPISIIFADLNGLKLMNDIFGHASGDELIKKSAAILRKNFRNEDLAARIGGDEFVVLLPNTVSSDAKLIVERLKIQLSREKVNAIKCSMALGIDTKNKSSEDIERIMGNAETEMYTEKSLSRRDFGADTINNIMSTLHERSPREKRHADEVSKLCVALGHAMELPETELRKLRDAGLLHDIGKIILSETILNRNNDLLTESEKEKVQQHPVVGYRILNLFEDTLDFADGVYGHHERWDGSGYPKRLKGKEITLLSRIISIAEAYERVLSGAYDFNPTSKEEALRFIRDGAGTQFDPQISELFVRMLETKNQNGD